MDNFVKITELTQSQRDRFPEYVEKWTRIGLCTDPADRPRAEEGIRLAYRIAGLRPPRIVWCGSPLANALVRASVQDSVRDSVVDSVQASVQDSVGASVWASVWASVGASVRASVQDSVRDSVGDSVWASVGASVRASVQDSVRDSVGDSVWASVYGQHDSFWIAFYAFFRDEVGLVTQTDKLAGLRMICESAGWCLPHHDICWVSERHNVLRMKGNRIHCEGGPTIAYPDGFSVWALNGVRVPQWLAEQPEGDIDPLEVLKIDNAQARAEGVRKIGVERLWAKYANVIDKSGAYELGLVPLAHGDNARTGAYLKMENPSVPELWHIEGVPNECTTVDAALSWRNGTAESPLVLS